MLDGLDPHDQVALAAYDNAPRHILPFTSDKSLLLAALGGIQYNIGMGELNFYGSLTKSWTGSIPSREKGPSCCSPPDSIPPSLRIGMRLLRKLAAMTL